MIAIRWAWLAAAALSLTACPAPAPIPSRFDRTSHLSRFFKGSTHSHTNRSGDALGAPIEHATWFKSNGWAFVFFTDHDKNGPPSDLAEIEDATFQVMEGEEYTYVSDTDGVKTHPHVNGLGTRTTVACGTVTPTWRALQDAVDRIRAQGGIAQINHPNHKWSLTSDDLLRVEGASLIEVENRHRNTHNEGDRKHESVESMWDKALVAGKRWWGVASDDSHTLPGLGRDGPDGPLPGRGWVQVAAASLTDAAVLAALRDGDFYWSAGAEIASIDVADDTMTVTLAPADAAAIVEFVGAGLKVLATERGPTATYKLNGHEGYVRARVVSGSRRAGTQPYFVQRK